MENPAATSRPEVFPVGLRVLVVDDDPTWLKILEKMLRKCSYEVTTCSLARVALEMLRERKEKFDIVISDVNMPDMDGFKLLEHVGLEMDLPVIMMSVDGETSRVMKGVQHGACDYLHKPIRMKELRNIWQHVYRKKIHEVKEIESQDINEDIHFIRNGSGDFDDKQLLSGADLNSLRKRKDVDSKEHSDQDFNDSATAKKARVVWSVDLHQKFVNAVNQIGLDKVGPKKILDLMNIPGLTRENVASHLQKYRLYLSRLQKQNEGRIFGANMEPDFSSKDRPVNFTNQNPTSLQRNTTADRHPCSTQKINVQSILPDIHVDEIKSIVSVQVKDHKEAADAGKVNVVLSFKGEMPSTDHRLREPAKHQTWSGSIPLMQFMQYPKHDHEPYGLLEDYSFPLQARQQFAPPVISITRGPEKDKMGLSQIKPVFTIDSEDFGAAHEISVLPSSKDGVELASSLPEDLSLCALQGIGYFENVDLNSMEFFEYDDSASMEVHSNWFDGLEINCEYLYDSVIDECLFA